MEKQSSASHRLLGAVLAGMVALAPSLSAQPISLDDRCTVSVGNQTVFVRPDGSFFLRNIAVFESRATGVAPQLYRVRATCLRSGR